MNNTSTVAFIVSIVKLFVVASLTLQVQAFSASSPNVNSNNNGAILQQQQEIKYKMPIVICPGFGNDSIDYDCPLKQPPSKGLKTILSTRGFDIGKIYTVPIQRTDWIRVGGGLFDIPNFYTNNARPDGLGYGWYLRKLKECVDLAHEESGGEKVILIGHSAGGWLARAAMGDGLWSSDEKTSEKISCLVTVGAIHKAPEDATTCVTRGALRFVEENYPGAFLKEEGIKYISVGGKAIVGDNDVDSNLDKTEADEVYSVRGEGSASKVAFTSYEAVCGDGNTVGDGVVPFEWTMLDGARQIELEGVLHSINEAGTTIPTDRWYGSENIVDRWLPDVLDEIDLVNDANESQTVLSGLQQWASNLLK